jgi:hypothetical protein
MSTSSLKLPTSPEKHPDFLDDIDAACVCESSAMPAAGGIDTMPIGAGRV